jgi:dipeptidyl aminopeptidase/acylaminoacyl peptidase
VSQPPLIDVEELFANAERAGAQVSPDGRHLAFLAPEKDRLNIWVTDLDQSDEPVCVSHEHQRGIKRYWWLADSQHLLYMQDEGGNERFHVYRVDITEPDADAVDLTPYPGVTCYSFDLPGGLPGRIIANLNLRTPTLFEPYLIDVMTGEATLVAENPGTATLWKSDRNGHLFTSAKATGGGWDVLRYDEATESLHAITTCAPGDTGYVLDPFQPTPDGTGIWVASAKDCDRFRLVRIDVATGEEAVVAEDDIADISMLTVAELFGPGLIRSARTGDVIAARFFRDRVRIQGVHPAYTEVLERIQHLCDGDLVGLSSDIAERWWVATFVRDREPHVTYLYDGSTGEGRLLFRSHPQLDPDQLAPMTPVEIVTRDGLRMQCYLTLPVGVPPQDLPLMLNIHGGPWHRDCWGFDPRTQFLANRGYAVLQVNMRGSIGFGKAFTEASYREFAGKMHDDLIDAVEWAVAQGYADRARVGIIGGSYGGYAALVGVTFTPDIFAAAVDICGISNLASFIRTLPAYVKTMLGNSWHHYVGDPDDPEQEADMLARSPITRVDDIRTPLMVVQGANDARVVQAESDNIVNALRTRGVPVEYLVKADEGHGFQNPENNYELFRILERFLGTHLGGRTSSL